MTDIFTFLKRHPQKQPWLIIGKGPTFSHIGDINLSDYTTVALNHVIREVKADFAHLIDFDVFETCQHDIVNNAKYLIMPMYPHFDCAPTERSLKSLCNDYPVLKQLDTKGRLLWYNHLRFRCVLHKRVNVLYFSAEAVVSILAKAVYRHIYTLGVDGGKNYSSAFDDLKGKTLLANKKPSFDLQFDHIRSIMIHNDIEVEPLVQDYPIKVYVATQEEQMLAVKVLEYSIQKHTDAPVEVYPLHLGNITYPEPNDIENRQRTPFSFQRFLIPQLNKYTGRAIYVDSDMQVFTDIKKLWNLPMGTHDVLTVVPTKAEHRRLQFSVMLLDCSKLNWEINDIIEKLNRHELSYGDLMYEMKIAKQLGVEIPETWNCLEWYKKGESALVHYTDMNTQPWISMENPLCNLWVEDLIEAIEKGFITIEYVREHIEKGYIRPSLMYQIEHKHLDSLSLPAVVKELDADFIAPYKGVHQHSGTPYANTLDYVIGKSKKIVRKLLKTYLS